MRSLGYLGLAGLLYIGYSAWEQRQQHRFAPAIAASMASVPGARLVAAYESGSLTNPVSWFWPAQTRLVYARPDPSTRKPRFFTFSFGIDDKDPPAIMLVAPDCDANTHVTYFPANAAEAGELAMSDGEQPLTAPNGSTFRRHDTGVPLAPKLGGLRCSPWRPKLQL